MNHEEAIAAVRTRQPRARLFRPVTMGEGEVVGWTWCIGDFTTTTFGYLTATGAYHPAVENYREHAERVCRLAAEDG